MSYNDVICNLMSLHKSTLMGENNFRKDLLHLIGHRFGNDFVECITQTNVSEIRDRL